MAPPWRHKALFSRCLGGKYPHGVTWVAKWPRVTQRITCKCNQTLDPFCPQFSRIWVKVFPKHLSKCTISHTLKIKETDYPYCDYNVDCWHTLHYFHTLGIVESTVLWKSVDALTFFPQVVAVGQFYLFFWFGFTFWLHFDYL